MNKIIIIGIAIAVIIVAVGVVAFRPSGLNSSYASLSVNGNGYTNTLNGSPNYHYDGTVTNSGTMTARNLRIEVRFYGQNHVLIGTQTATIGDVPAHTSKNFSIDVPCPTQPIYGTEVTPLWEP